MSGVYLRHTTMGDRRQILAGFYYDAADARIDDEVPAKPGIVGSVSSTELVQTKGFLHSKPLGETRLVIMQDIRLSSMTAPSGPSYRRGNVSRTDVKRGPGVFEGRRSFGNRRL